MVLISPTTNPLHPNPPFYLRAARLGLRFVVSCDDDDDEDDEDGGGEKETIKTHFFLRVNSTPSLAVPTLQEKEMNKTHPCFLRAKTT